MPPFLPFEQQLLAAWPPERWRDVRVLVAVSGGPDSVALLRAMHRLNGESGNLAAAHLNHGIRGAAALADQQFVAELCQKLNVRCEISAVADLGDQIGGEGLEAAARAARYEFLGRTAEQLGARYLVTGHTADDQAETILHHIVRGTGLKGLAGMPRVRPLGPAVTLVRPMLEITRTAVVEYLAALDQPYREDETNRDRSLTRNRIRHELVPLLAREYSPAIVDALLRLGALAGEAQHVIDALSESLLESSVLECDAAHVVFDCGPLRTSERHLVRVALIAAWRRQGWPQQSMGWAQWNQLADMALADESSDTAKQVLPGAVIAERRDNQLCLSAEGSRYA